MIDKSKIGEQIKELRESRGWTQTSLSDKLGMSPSYVSNVEAGRRSLTLVTLKKFCEVFNVDISYFGIETDNFNDAVDLTARLEKIFNSDMDEAQKDELYRKIMRIYLDSKES